MIVKDKKELPKYLRIEGDFRARIESGRLRDGDLLPDERALAVQLGCNRLTVNKAYNLLQEKGYVHKVQGSGVYVGRRNVEGDHAGLFAGARKILGFALGECLEGSSPVMVKHSVFDVFRANDVEPLCLSYVTQAELRQRLLLYQRFLDGLIFHCSNFDAIADNYRFFEGTGRPTVVIGVDHTGQVERFGADAVVPDSARGGAMAAEYFLHRGHKQIVAVGMRPGDAKRFDRIAGFAARLSQEGIKPAHVIPELDPLLADKLKDFSAMRIKLMGAKAAEMAMAKAVRPTAIFCLNDSLAVGVHEQLKHMGVRCPQDVELLGCGGDHEAAFYYRDGVVPISTIAIPHAQTGKLAAQALLARLENPGAPRQVVAVPMHLLHRQTTQP